MFLSFASNIGTVSAEIQMDITYEYETHFRSTLRQAGLLDFYAHKFPVSSSHASRMTSHVETHICEKLLFK